MSDDIEAADLFYVPGDDELDPQPIAARLVRTDEKFEHLRHGNASVLFLMRRDEVVKNHRRILGTMNLPRFQGSLGPLASWARAKLFGEVPDFIMILDAEWWTQATPLQREALVFHELLHADHMLDKEGEPRFDDEGNPIWGLRGHDIEEFNDVVERYGAWSPDIGRFIQAAHRGGAA